MHQAVKFTGGHKSQEGLQNLASESIIGQFKGAGKQDRQQTGCERGLVALCWLDLADLLKKELMRCAALTRLLKPSMLKSHSSSALAVKLIKIRQFSTGCLVGPPIFALHCFHFFLSLLPEIMITFSCSATNKMTGMAMLSSY